MIDCCEFYGLKVAEPFGDVPVSEAQVQIADMYLYQQGMYTWQKLNEFYNGADMLLAPSRGEGFCIPLIEAQASGCPVVATKFTAQEELIGPGYGIEPAWIEYSIQQTEHAMVAPGDVYDGIAWVKEQEQAPLRAKSREFAMGYDAQVVYETYMKPFFQRIDERNRQRDVRTAQRVALRKLPVEKAGD